MLPLTGGETADVRRRPLAGHLGGAHDRSPRPMAMNLDLAVGGWVPLGPTEPKGAVLTCALPL